LFNQTFHPQQTLYAYIHDFASTHKNKSNAFTVQTQSFCTFVSVLNNNYELPIPGTDVLNWLWNITEKKKKIFAACSNC